MLRIGYVQLRDMQSADHTTALKALGCHVVRAGAPAGRGEDDSASLGAILDFIGEGDELVVIRLEHLAHCSRSALDVIDRLERKGATLLVVEPEISSTGEGGRALRAALLAVSAVEAPAANRKRRGAASADQIVALQEAGVGPVEIARRLGVSRMTVWRKLKAVEA